MSTMDDHEKLREGFNRGFAHWEIELPVDAMSPGVVWLIVQRGWTIWTRLDIDPENGRERLDYYAMHRMTNDRHVRLYADGEEEALPAMRMGLRLPGGRFRDGEGSGAGQVPRAQPGGREAAPREGIRHDGPGPPERSGQPVLEDPPLPGRRLLTARNGGRKNIVRDLEPRGARREEVEEIGDG